MKDPNCGYCARGELLDAFGIVICELNVSTLILFKEQSHPGRCVVAYKDHVSEIVDLTDEERNAFMADVNRAAKAIHAAFHPDKLNYGAYGDTGCHPACASRAEIQGRLRVGRRVRDESRPDEADRCAVCRDGRKDQGQSVSGRQQGPPFGRAFLR